MSYRIEEAYGYYLDHILAPLRAKTPIYEDRNIPMEGLVPFRDWEVMGAILVDDRGTATRSGADLANHEVKSAKRPGSFEYQYHRTHGVEKLDHDLTIEHLYVVYESGYGNIDVYSLTAEQFAEIGNAWREGLVEAYRNPRNQRYRRTMPYHNVVEGSRLIMRIRDGLLVETEDDERLFG